MTLVREPGSEVIGQFSIPYRGTWKNTPAHKVPSDALYDSLNVFVREGVLRARPGLVLFNGGPFINIATDKDRHIIGGAMGVTPERKYVFAASPTRLATYNDVSNSWNSYNVTAGQTLADSELDTIDITFIETSSTYAVLLANDNYPLKFWTLTSPEVSDVTGTNIPYPKSVCIASSRVIALVPPHTVTWSSVLDFTIFNGIAKRAQTTDTGICVRTLSALSFVLYKENSIHMARAQAGTNENTAFAFSEPIISEGPAGIYAVTDVNGSHMYMTRSGRIGIFDGTTYPTWIADGLWFFLQKDINRDFAYLIRGVYDYRLNTVMFFYPKVNQPPNLNGIVVVNLPFSSEQQTGISAHCFLGRTHLNVTHVLSKRFDNEIDNALIFEAPNTPAVPQTYTFDETVTFDAGSIYNCLAHTGLQPMPDARYTHVTTEHFFERGSGYGSVNAEAVTSDSLDNSTGVIADLEGKAINLEQPIVNEYIGFNKKKRFFGLKYTWTSDNIVKYHGTVLYNSMTKG